MRDDLQAECIAAVLSGFFAKDGQTVLRLARVHRGQVHKLVGYAWLWAGHCCLGLRQSVIPFSSNTGRIGLGHQLRVAVNGLLQ